MRAHCKCIRVCDSTGGGRPGILFCAVRAYVAGTGVGSNSDCVSECSVVGNCVWDGAQKRSRGAGGRVSVRVTVRCKCCHATVAIGQVGV